MKHDEARRRVRRAAQWAGFDLDDTQIALLETYADWLIEEAIPAGGLGGREGPRLWDRHVADSLVFATAWPTPPSELLDVGSGVGLPGIPLSILWPDCHVTLLDRGGRRVRLVSRALRVLALPCTHAAQGDVFAVADEWEAITFRAAVTPMEAVGLSSKLLADSGTAVVGLSRRPEQPAAAGDLVAMSEALGLRAEIRPVPTEILDGGAWLLIMTR